LAWFRQVIDAFDRLDRFWIGCVALRVLQRRHAAHDGGIGLDPRSGAFPKSLRDDIGGVPERHQRTAINAAGHVADHHRFSSIQGYYWASTSVG